MNLQTRIILIIFYLFSQFSFAQWQINKGPYGGNFSVVSGRNDTLFSVVLPNLIYQKENNQDWQIVNTNLPNSIQLNKSILIFEDNIYLGSNSSGVFKKNLNSNSWVNEPSLPSQVLCFSIIDTNVFAGSSSGIYKFDKSTDTWVYISNQLNNIRINNIYSDSSGQIYVATDKGVFYSNNQAQNFSIFSHVNQDINSIIIKGDTFIVCGSTLLQSSYNGGTNWVNSNTGLSAYASLGFYDLLIKNDTVFLATERGLYYSVNYSYDWIYYNHIGTKKVNNIDFINNNIYVSTIDGLYKITDLNYSAELFCDNIYNLNLKSLEVSNSNILCSNNYGAVFCRKNNQWIKNNFTDTHSIIYDIFSNPVPYISIPSVLNLNDNLYAAVFANGIYCNLNSTQLWDVCNQGTNNPYVYSLKKHNDILYAAVSNKLYTSNDFGNEWQELGNHTGLSSIKSFDISDSLICISSGGEILNVFSAGPIYCSNDNANTWQNLNVPNNVFGVQIIDNEIWGLASSKIFRLRMGEATWEIKNIPGLHKKILKHQNKLILAGIGNIYISYDDGVNWINVNYNLPNLNINDINIYQDTLFAATELSLWKISLNDIMFINNVNFSTKNLIIYPNPASNTITINLPENTSELRIYNYAGQLVEQIMLSNKEQIIQLNVAHYPSGIYLLQAQGQHDVQVKKFVKQ